LELGVFFWEIIMAKSDNIQAHTDKYSLVGALDPDTGEINPVRVGDTTVLGLATQLYVWNTSTLVWDKMTQPSISADTINVASTPDTTDLSTDNSTTTPLGGDAVYTGTGEDMLGYAQVAITIYADVDSAASGMQFQWSQDNTNWDDSYDFTLDFSSSPTRRFQFPVCARYFRVKYTNGAGAQSAFRVQTILHRGNVLTSIHRIGATLTGDRSCQVVKASIVGETTGGGGGYVNVKVSPSGALTMEAEQSDASKLNMQLGGTSISSVDSNNSTVAQLGNGAVFTGTGTDLLGYVALAISVYSDYASAANGLSLQFSQDNSNWDIVYTHTVAATTPYPVVIPAQARYFRLVYTNGTDTTTQLRIQTLLLPVNVLPQIERIDGVIEDASLAYLGRSVIVGESSAGGGSFINAKVDAGGSLEVVANQDTAADLNMTEASAAAILAEVQDALADYKFSGYVVSGTAVYLGYEDKGGAYYVQYIETSTGVVTYAKGTGGIVAPGSYSGLSYASFASTF
jgi:hypothetical protein